MSTDAVTIHRGRDRLSLNASFPLAQGDSAQYLLRRNRTARFRLGLSVDGMTGFMAIDLPATAPQPLTERIKENLAQCLLTASADQHRDTDDLDEAEGERINIGERMMWRTVTTDQWTRWTYPVGKCRVEHQTTPAVEKALSHYGSFLNTQIYFGSLFYCTAYGWGFSTSLPPEADADLRNRALLKFDQLGRSFMASLWPNILALNNEDFALEYNRRNGLTRQKIPPERR